MPVIIKMYRTTDCALIITFIQKFVNREKKQEEIVENVKKITIADVAEHLGVSKTTVSRAISGKGRISEETRKRVLEYIEAENYKPNVIAKGLAQ